MSQSDKVKTAVLTDLLSGYAVTVAATRNKVNPRTIWRWIAEDEEFTKTLAASTAPAVKLAALRLSEAVDEAVMLMRMFMQDGKLTPTVRMRAASHVLSNAIRFVETGEILTRIEELEAATGQDT